jgi:prepilin-type N-terminal cleavage/methylation domain-containing protein
MISLKKRNQGFTIVELLIVIVVIGILALLVITTYSGIQAKARDSKRSSDVKSLQTQVEAYFSQQGHYPSRADMNNAGWLKTNMPSLDVNATKDPKSATADCDTTSNTSGCFAATPTTGKHYEFAPTQSDGTTACESDDTGCAAYNLVANYEGTVNGQSSASAKNLD